MVVNGCTIVSNPTPTHFTNCANANLAGVDLSSVNLSYANLGGAVFASCQIGTCSEALGADLSSANLSFADLAGAQFVDCSYPGNCTSASVRGANLTDANLSSTTLAECVFFLEVACGAADFTDAVMPGANLSGADIQTGIMESADLEGANLTGTNLGGASLAFADLSGANLTDASLTSTVPPIPVTYYASLNGANVTGTLLVPSNQSLTATSQAGAIATWSTPPAIPGATPGSCTPASGSTFPLFSTTVTCQVLDHANEVATGTFQVDVLPTTQYFTRVFVPPNGTVLSGAPYLDAGASDGPGVTKVVFEVTEGSLINKVIATATPTYYGWIAQWNTTTVPNGNYSLESVATDADNNTDTSTPITVMVNNQPPVTAVLIPSNGATLSGTSATLDASASNATSVEFLLFGGTYGYSAPVVCTATPTYYGWLCSWNTTDVSNGSYALVSEASGADGNAFSSPISITVDNPPPNTTVVLPQAGGTLDSAQGYVLDAVASPGVTHVSIEAVVGAATYPVTATPTIYGWIVTMPATPPCNGNASPDCRALSASASIQSVASYSGGVTGTSPPVPATIIIYELIG
jgi:uncharacterized protein YjbI with pentapeptide repeats